MMTESFAESNSNEGNHVLQKNSHRTNMNDGIIDFVAGSLGNISLSFILFSHTIVYC